MTWIWDPSRWKRSTRLLIGGATIWPLLYIFLFIFIIFSMVLILPFDETGSGRGSEIDLLQLERKIQNGEVKELIVRPDEIVVSDRAGRKYHTSEFKESTREEIIRMARELGADGQPRAPMIVEENNRQVSRVFPAGFIALFAVHLLTMLLIMALMPLYIILVVKNEHLDQTMRIVWVVLICMVAIGAMPVYWYLNIWRDPRGRSGPQQDIPPKV